MQPGHLGGEQGFGQDLAGQGADARTIEKQGPTDGNTGRNRDALQGWHGLAIPWVTSYAVYRPQGRGMGTS